MNNLQSAFHPKPKSGIISRTRNRNPQDEYFPNGIKPQNSRTNPAAFRSPISVRNRLSERVREDGKDQCFSILYLFNSKRSQYLLKKVSERCTKLDTVQTYSDSTKMADMAKRADSVFDYIVVLGASDDQDKLLNKVSG